MFTGLIQDVGTVVRMGSDSMRDVWVKTSLPTQDFQLGESIACDGVCLTVVESVGDTFRVQASPETLRRSTLGEWTVGRSINLERALRVGDRLGGHWVLGHVDGVTTLLSQWMEGEAWAATLSLSSELAPFFIEKGSVTLDGVSLTVNSLTDSEFSIMLIPETQKRTTLAAKKPRDTLNVEADVLGKYAARLHRHPSSGGLTEESLKKAGFHR